MSTTDEVSARPSRDTRYPFVTRCLHWKPNVIDPDTGHRVLTTYSYRFMRARSARHAQSILLADNKDPNFTPSLTYSLRPTLPHTIAQCFARNGWNLASGEAARVCKRRYLIPGHPWYVNLQSGLAIAEWQASHDGGQHEVKLPAVGSVMLPATALLLPYYD